MIKIKVTKIFGTHDISLDLSDICTIILGENGLGKSSILNILKCLISGDFIGLTKYPFEKITIRNGKKYITIKFEDLFPIKNDFIENLSTSDIPIITFMAIAKSKISPSKRCDNDDILTLEYRLSNMDNQEYLNYLSMVYWDYRPSSVQDVFLNNDQAKNQLVKEILKKLAYDSCFLLSTISKDSRYKAVLLKIRMLLNINFEQALITSYTFKYSSDNPVFLYSATNDYLLDNRYKPEYRPYNTEINRLSHTLNCPVLYGGCYTEEQAEELKSIYSHLEESTHKSDIISRDISQMVSNNILPLCAIICDNIYSEKDIININKKAADYFIEHIGELKDSEFNNPTLLDSFYEKNKEFIEDFVEPILIKNSIFSMSNEEVYYEPDPFDFGVDLGDDVTKAFVNFVKDNMEWITKLRSPRVIAFEKILSKFFFNKKVRVTPRGIKIYNLNNKQIDLQVLSSGEKKVIALFTAAIFFSNTYLLIDEPEISLSIIWQNWLLPTLLSQCKSNKIIVATHSPYIAEDETIQKYVQPLYINIIGDN